MGRGPPRAAAVAGLTSEDRCMMRRALGLAERGRGATAPNPMVGCVLVKRGKILGEGFHPKAGEPHAEIFALRDAQHRGNGWDVPGCTAYVSLEPCDHHGRTGPCSVALCNAKVGRVVVGMVDPNPLVNSGGIARLVGAGIEVDVMDGEEAQLCADLNVEFIARIAAERAAAEEISMVEDLPAHEGAAEQGAAEGDTGSSAVSLSQGEGEGKGKGKGKGKGGRETASAKARGPPPPPLPLVEAPPPPKPQEVRFGGAAVGAAVPEIAGANAEVRRSSSSKKGSKRSTASRTSSGFGR